MAPLLAAPRRSDRTFERMYRKHVHDVYRYSLAVLRNPADAEDVTQTTFMNAYRAFERGERPRQAQNWLITIAHNVCRQRFRHQARRPVEAEWNDAIASVVPDDDHAGPSIADVQRALAHLPFNQRSALVLRELEGRSYAEIAEMLDVTVSAVETLIFRARRALREQLEGTLTCGDAELAISRQLDAALPRAERGALRAHLRECKDCARHARRLRAQRAALKGLGAATLPPSLVSWLGGGSAAAATGAFAGAGVATKAAAVVAAGVVAAGAGHELTTRDAPSAAPPAAERAARSVAATPAPPHAPIAIASPARTAPPARDERASRAAVAKGQKGVKAAPASRSSHEPKPKLKQKQKQKQKQAEARLEQQKPLRLRPRPGAATGAGTHANPSRRGLPPRAAARTATGPRRSLPAPRARVKVPAPPGAARPATGLSGRSAESKVKAKAKARPEDVIRPLVAAPKRKDSVKASRSRKFVAEGASQSADVPSSPLGAAPPAGP